MTEAEWLACKNPDELYHWLTQRDPTGLTAPEEPFRITERQMRLIAAAAVRLLSSEGTVHKNTLGTAAEMLADGSSWATVEKFMAPAKTRAYWATIASAVDSFRQSFSCTENQRRVVPDVIRDIVRYPEAPVALPPGDKCKKCRGKGTVPAGAGGAVPHRNLRLRCKACSGRGTKLSPIVTDTVLDLARTAYSTQLSTGCLDPDRLAILSDALEEAGLEAGACPKCAGKGEQTYTSAEVERFPTTVYTFRKSAASSASWPESISIWCQNCAGTGKIEHPVLKHLRRPGRHWKGMWSLDLVLGNS